MIFDVFPFSFPFSPSTSHTYRDNKTGHHSYPRPDKEQLLYRSFNQLLGSVDLDDDKIEEMRTSVRQPEEMGSFMFSKPNEGPSITGAFYLQRL
jgi:hypothetical protein